MNEGKDPSRFLRRLQATAVGGNIETCPMATSILKKYTKCLVENPLNRAGVRIFSVISAYIKEERRN